MTEEQKLQFLTCSVCQGQGRVENSSCQECGGSGLMAWTEETLLYFGKKINSAQIYQDNIKALIKNFIDLALFLFGALGIIMLGWTILLYGETGQSFLYFYRAKSWPLFIFWLSLASNSYLFYRISRSVEKIKNIPRQKYKTFSNSEAVSQKDTDKSKAKKIDIAPYFTDQVHQTINQAWQLAKKYNHQEINPVHLLVALTSSSQIQLIFSRLGIPFATLKSKISRTLGRQAEKDKEPVALSRQTKEIFFQSYYLAFSLNQKKVGVTEILEALASRKNEVEELLYDLNVTLDKIKNVIAWIRITENLRQNYLIFKQKALLKPKNKIETPVLNAFGQDLTLLARAGYILPCVGREKEINGIFDVMSGGASRSVLLLGNPGVGKNTVIEGIAQKIVGEDVPSFLRDKRLVKLDIAKLIASTTPTRSQERLMIILNEIKKSGNVILCLNNLNSIVGIAASRAGGVEVLDALYQAIANNTVLVIATATPRNYKHFIENKTALDDVIEKIDIKQPTGNKAIQILESKVGVFEYQNQVFFSYAAVTAAVELSNKYLPDRFLPEKGIEILRETAIKIGRQKGKNAFITKDDVAFIISEKTGIPLNA